MTSTLPGTSEAGARPTTIPPRQAALLSSTRVEQKGNIVVKWVTSTDHKTIGYMYLIASVLFFLLGGVMALIIRAELFSPGMQIVPTKEQYNQLFTMHGTIMLLMFATPLFAGFANAILPLQIGAPDVAFPRLNAFAFWLFLFGSTIAVAGFLTPQGAASFGWFAYQPLASASFTPGAGGNLWMMGLGISGFGTILGAVNFITTIITMRAPGMTMWRMPIFSWNTLITSLLVLMAFPVLAAAILAAAADRILGAHIYDPANGGVLLWQHLFWFFGHPEVYIIALPFFGIVSEIFPVFSRKPIFGYKTLVYATISIAALSVAVWAHHMYVTGSVLLPFFALMTMLIAVPDRREDLQLDRHAVARIRHVRDAHGLRARLPGVVRLRRSHRRDPRVPAAGLLPLRLLLRRRALPLRGVRHGRVRDVRRLLLLVAEVDRPDAQRAPRLRALLDALHRLPHDVPDPALAGRRRHAASLRRLLGRTTTGRGRTRSRRSARSSSAPRCCRSS